MRLMKSLFGHGYKLFIDNYYPSVQLIFDLLTCGTISANRNAIPIQMKANKKNGEQLDGLGSEIEYFYNG